MGLIRYSCGHMLGPYEPISTQFGLWRFFIMLFKTLKCKKSFLWRHHFDTLWNTYNHELIEKDELVSTESLEIKFFFLSLSLSLYIFWFIYTVGCCLNFYKLETLYLWRFINSWYCCLNSQWYIFMMFIFAIQETNSLVSSFPPVVKETVKHEGILKH